MVLPRLNAAEVAGAAAAARDQPQSQARNQSQARSYVDAQQEALVNWVNSGVAQLNLERANRRFLLPVKVARQLRQQGIAFHA